MNLRGLKHAGENKLNINLENCVFLWCVLYNYTTMHGAKEIKNILKLWFEFAFCVFYCKLQ